MISIYEADFYAQKSLYVSSMLHGFIIAEKKFMSIILFLPFTQIFLSVNGYTNV